ncbi:MAG: hypothetical protein HQL99_11400 [Magnetococcales bacterium]|nr:hypothetical protein [Magnetococcales bacterium]
MTTRTTPSTTPRTIQIRVTEKGKIRLVDADVLPNMATPEPYQKRHQLSDQRNHDDGEALLKELRGLVYMRREQGQGITPEELLPFLDDLDGVLVRGWTEMSEALQRLGTASSFLRRWCGACESETHGHSDLARLPGTAAFFLKPVPFPPLSGFPSETIFAPNSPWKPCPIEMSHLPILVSGTFFVIIIYRYQ